ncbi:LacI family transcriptional regulator [Paenibacillus phyllosphaerae]|uniref:LacI family transcriptional regulator n=1 Tax=Paenibacillus phyllosphaerae TaxID=274593 RepID=A0A7W5B492_9BACL|nr:LacI family DNA-binding transcriptional regulator [Paenibacillus phyllosphaerae]MBB3113957.1 LacI family transcriptional regulator [Paenibacillus phyllosphaerae]
MTRDKVTIQDIADALGISRNTASKALNGNESIPAETRNKVIKKAAELKYKQFAFVDTEGMIARTTGNIALFTSNMPNSSHFGSLLLSGLEKKISSDGFNLSIHFVREPEISQLLLPNNFEPSKVDGIICIEMFNKAYSDLIGSLGIPAIFIDASARIDFSELQADVILMENDHSTHSVVKRLIRNGHKRIGFAGDYNHCLSFYERWAGYNRALLEAGLPADPASCIVGEDRFFNDGSTWIDDQLEAMEQLPSAFVCANDFIAVAVMRTLKGRNIRVPDEVAVVGFDNSPESRIIEPPLTTVHIPNSDMGIITAELLLSRIKNPSKPYQVAHVQTEPIYRESTGTLGE